MTAVSLFNKEKASAPLASLIRPGRMEITPTIARLVLDEANYDRQRKVYALSLQRMVDLINSDQWVDGCQLWFVRIDGALYLVDGQHRLTGIWTTGATRTFTVEIVDCATPEEVHELYARMDRIGRKRTDAEMLDAMGVAEGLGVGRLATRAAFKAMPYLASAFSTGRHGSSGALPTDMDKIAFMAPWRDAIRNYSELIHPAESDVKRGLLNPGIMAVALLTVRDQPAKATDFWGQVAADDGLRRNDPRHTLVAAIRNRDFKGDGLHGARVATVAWNAFFQNRTIGFIRATERTEIRIAGVKAI